MDNKNKLFWVVLVFLFYVAVETSSFFTLCLIRIIFHSDFSPISVTSLSDKHKKIIEDFIEGKTNYITYSSTTGWAIKQNGFSGLYTANSKGIRGNREYELIPPGNTVRISSFGDSFTHCDDVRNEDTWQEMLNSASANLEVLNFGVGGYGLDQSFLRYQQQGILNNSNIILIGFMSDDINRNVSVFRPFYYATTGLPLAKPRYTIENDRLVLNKNPIRELSQYKDLLTLPRLALPQLGVNDYHFQIKYKEGPFDFLPSVRVFKILRWYYWKLIDGRYAIVKSSYYNENSEAFKITTKIFDRFVNTASRNGSLPIIIVFPNKEDVLRYRRDKTRRYTPLLEYFNSKGYHYIDILDAFDMYSKDVKKNNLFTGGLHYSPLANKLVARYILHYLQEAEVKLN